MPYALAGDKRIEPGDEFIFDHAQYLSSKTFEDSMLTTTDDIHRTDELTMPANLADYCRFVQPPDHGLGRGDLDAEANRVFQRS